MALKHIKKIAFTGCLMTLLFVFTAAYADGMPDIHTVPTPLDKAIDQVENKQPPAVVAPPKQEPLQHVTPAPEQQPAAATLTKDEMPAAPVPAARVVEVQPHTAFFGLSVGMYGPHSGGDKLAIGLQYQTAFKIGGVLQPLFGAMISSEGSILGYGGVGVPFHLGQHILVMPSLAVGAYKQGAGYNLGQTIAYRAGTEIAYEFQDKSRIGLDASFITNGNSLQSKDRIGVIALTYTTPVSLLSGK